MDGIVSDLLISVVLTCVRSVIFWPDPIPSAKQCRYRAWFISGYRYGQSKCKPTSPDPMPPNFQCRKLEVAFANEETSHGGRLLQFLRSYELHQLVQGQDGVSLTRSQGRWSSLVVTVPILKQFTTGLVYQRFPQVFRTDFLSHAPRTRCNPKCEDKTGSLLDCRRCFRLRFQHEEDSRLPDMYRRSILVAIERIGGAGKTTQVDLLWNALSCAGVCLCYASCDPVER